LQRYAIETFEDIGFDASGIDAVNQYLLQHHVPPYVVHLRVRGMMCQKNCGTTVENALCSVVDAITTSSTATTTLVEVWAIFRERHVYDVFRSIHSTDGTFQTKLTNDCIEAIE
jgi:hypothetical protein